MEIKIKKLHQDAQIPIRQTEKSVGADLHAYINSYEGFVTIKPGETVKIDTGIAMELPPGYMGLVFARSGLATKKGLAPANKVGVIDEDYRGEIIVALHNHSQKMQTITNGERIAQLVVVPYLPFEFYDANELSNTTRGNGGFGSTGIN